MSTNFDDWKVGDVVVLSSSTSSLLPGSVGVIEGVTPEDRFFTYQVKFGKEPVYWIQSSRLKFLCSGKTYNSSVMKAIRGEV